MTSCDERVDNHEGDSLLKKVSKKKKLGINTIFNAKEVLKFLNSVLIHLVSHTNS